MSKQTMILIGIVISWAGWLSLEVIDLGKSVTKVSACMHRLEKDFEQHNQQRKH